jgi:hypothetical protein
MSTCIECYDKRHKAIYFIYSCVKPFLDRAKSYRISFSKGNIATSNISYFNPYQVEEQNGGKAPNLEVFWPPVFPNYPTDLDAFEERPPKIVQKEVKRIQGKDSSMMYYGTEEEDKLIEIKD